MSSTSAAAVAIGVGQARAARPDAPARRSRRARRASAAARAPGRGPAAAPRGAGRTGAGSARGSAAPSRAGARRSPRARPRRMRSRRSSPRSRTSRSHHGTVITATPTSVASTASSANWTWPSCRGCRAGTPRSRRRRTRAPAITRHSAEPAGQPGAGALGPAAALGLVGLPPHDGGAGDRATPSGPTTQPRVESPSARGARTRRPMPERGEPERLLALGRRARAARRRPPPAGTKIHSSP